MSGSPELNNGQQPVSQEIQLTLEQKLIKHLEAGLTDPDPYIRGVRQEFFGDFAEYIRADIEVNVAGHSETAKRNAAEEKRDKLGDNMVFKHSGTKRSGDYNTFGFNDLGLTVRRLRDIWTDDANKMHGKHTPKSYEAIKKIPDRLISLGNRVTGGKIQPQVKPVVK